MKAIRRLLLFALIVIAAIVFYAWMNYKKPTVTYANKVELVDLSDTSCDLNVSLRVKNENFFSLTAKDLNADLGSGTTGKMMSEKLFIPGSSDSVYVVPLRINFSSINNMITQLSNPVPSSVKKTLSFDTKVASVPFYFHISFPIADTVKKDGNKILAMLIAENISVTDISRSGDFSIDSTDMILEMKIKNPYSIPFTIKSYQLVVKNPSDANANLATLQSTGEIVLTPGSERSIKNKLDVNPGTILLHSVINFLENEEYKLNFKGTINIMNHEFEVSQNFSYKLFKK